MLSFSRSFIGLLDLTRNTKGYEIFLEGNIARGQIVEICRVVDVITENKVNFYFIKYTSPYFTLLHLPLTYFIFPQIYLSSPNPIFLHNFNLNKEVKLKDGME
jgi:hypothetical protein